MYCGEGQQLLYTVTKSFTLRQIQSGFRMQEKRWGSKAPLCTCLWKWGETKARLVLQHRPRLNSPHHRNWFLLMPLYRAGAFLKENPQTANILNTFFHLYSWMFNEAVQVKIQVKCRMYYSSGGSLETWTNDPVFISRFLPLLMDTVEGLEMLLQPHISEIVIYLAFFSASERSAVCTALRQTCV